MAKNQLWKNENKIVERSNIFEETAKMHHSWDMSLI